MKPDLCTDYPQNFEIYGALHSVSRKLYHWKSLINKSKVETI